ncbi:hypothetical protein L873DRAFT_1834569 [Choiromyces venosus 120613-1]|uniref:Secreted protein n=1 Tax=Choiromyces venosus 120613-1 TaxID=1336337 RepID=A0A3N4JT42_9PEZI|nr:hypothetical protein L873DRAFT_1834569 [Choiromyces venosus 120613-1]
MKFLAVSSLLLSAVLATPLPQSTVVPDPSQVQISDISYAGTGCPPGTVGLSFTTNKKTLALVFDKYRGLRYVASIGPAIPITESRKYCQININLDYPGDFQYSVFSSDYSGYVNLDAGVTCLQKSIYYFSGSTAQASTQANFTGPLSQDYWIHNEVPLSSAVWSPCGSVKALNINSQLRLYSTPNNNGSGFTTTESIGENDTFNVGVRWQACK